MLPETSYVPLWCKSNYSFLEGASHPDELIEEAHRMGIPALGLTDRDGVYGMVRAHMKARELGVQLLVGAEVTVDDGSTIVLLARDRAGYGNLCSLLSTGRLRCPKGQSQVSWTEVCEHAPGLVALWGGGRALIAASDLAEDGSAPDAVAGDLRDAFGDEHLNVLLTRHRAAHDARREQRLRAHATRYALPTVAAGEVHKSQRLAGRPLALVLFHVAARTSP